jgi:2-amino-4-hydroxy-6-hydroxymethyldihydropteridine diphosphokinase
MTIAFIGLGSNLEQPIQQLDNAITALRELRRSQLMKCSAYYGSTAIGPGSQPDYVNAVAQISTNLPAMALLNELHTIEEQQDRVREIRWGPRTIDLDILLYGENTVKEKQLTIPHPRLKERPFVIVPLFDIAPLLILPGGLALRYLLATTEQADLWRLNS